VKRCVKGSGPTKRTEKKGKSGRERRPWEEKLNVTKKEATGFSTKNRKIGVETRVGQKQTYCVKKQGGKEGGNRKTTGEKNQKSQKKKNKHKKKERNRKRKNRK